MEVSPCIKLSSIQVFGIIAVFLSIVSAQQTSASTVPKAYTNFIKKSCNSTTYASLCVKTLTPYASSVKTIPLRLCNAALNVALQGATDAMTTVSKIAKRNDITKYEAKAIKDCIEDTKDTVYELKQTLNAMGHLNDPDKNFQWANAKTYASAAITDMESCMDGLSGKKVNPSVKKKIKSSISAGQKLISNALSLINHLY